MEEVGIVLIHPGEKREKDIHTDVFAQMESVGRDEFVAAGQKGYKELRKFAVWSSEYDGQKKIAYNGKRLSIYRTYDRKDDRTELYTAERIGNNGRG